MNTYIRSKSRTRRTSMSFMQDASGKWRSRNRRVSHMDQDEEDSEDDDEDKKHVVTNWAEEFFGRRSISDSPVEQQDVEVHLTKRQTLILSTLVPDEVLLLDRFDTGEPRRFVGVLLMADVSGYTALSERYNNIGKGGTYRLTATLNTYLGALIEIIYSHGGDIIKFAGDAFLALWKTDKRTYLSHTIHSVIACALVIQHSYARYETDVKVNLRVKLAISAGNLMFSPIGTGIDMNYIIFGLPVIEAKLAESMCSSGEVKLSPSSWAHCYSRNYDHIVHEDGHVTIKAILYDPHDKDVSKPFLGFGAMLRQVKKFNCLEDLPEFIWNTPKNLNPSELAKKNEVLGLRKAILIAEDKDLGSKIRNFMIRPVLTQIDAHQPLEYLTEMRQVSIIFVTLKPRECPPAQLITIVNNSYQITCEIVYKSMGCVNKIILFDKDVMILVVFGLRGFKHESEAQAALKCAYSIRKSVAALDGVREVSIGVTTGQVYCGVVGHPLRREFTVIGAIVNKAARLMCNFRNKISCDEATFVKSKMSKNGFTLQPKTELKGIGSPGKIYEYTEEIRIKEFRNIPVMPPLLDRSDETEYFENWLEQAPLTYRDFDALLLIGESRIGKSRLLEWLARISTNAGFKVCYIGLTSIHSANSYLALSQIINQLLGLDSEPTTGFVKEQKVVDLLKTYDDDLCCLNNIIKVRFAYHEGIYSLNEAQREDKAKAIFEKLMKALPETYVILLDDLQNLDAGSWEYISLMLSVQKIFTVLTLTRGKFSSVHQWLYNVLLNDSIRKIVLGPLSFDWIPALACQILDVDAVPNDLCNALKTHCKGMPGLVESLIVHLFSSGAVELQKVTDEDLEEYKQEDLQFADPELLKPQALNIKDQEMLDSLREKELTGEMSICIVTNKDELNTNFNDHNLDTVIMVQIDSLTPYQQLLLKIASVIGNIVSRDLLENIMYENDPLVTAKAIKRLFAMKIFSCASAKSKHFRGKSSSFNLTPLEKKVPLTNKYDCVCDIEFDPENSNGLPKYAYCKVMRFRNKNSRQTCYELLPMNQKKEFHSRIVHYLENNEHKCPACGGPLIVVPPVLISGENEDERPVCSTEIFESKKVTDSDNDSVIDDTNTKVNRTKSENIRKSEGTVRGSHGRSSSDTNARSSLNNEAKTKSLEEETVRRKSSKRATISSFLFQPDLTEQPIDENNVFGMFRKIMEAKNFTDWQNVGIQDSKDDLQVNEYNEEARCFTLNIEKGVSQTDFKKCTCAELKIMIYEQLIHHALQAEMKINAIEFLITYCYFSFLADNNEAIIDKLEEAECLCLEAPTTEQKQVIPKPYLKRFLARIYTLKAADALQYGKLLAAKVEIEKAIRLYKLAINKGSRLLKIKDIFAAKDYANERKRQADSVFCLNIATYLYTALGDEKTSRTCAYYAIDMTQKVYCRVADICDAFASALHIELARGSPENTTDIEKILKNVIRRVPHPIKANELYALGKLFIAIFHARLARAELVSSIRAAYRALVLSNFLKAFNVSIIIIPDVFYILISRRRIEEAIEIAQMCLRLYRSKNTQEAETWRATGAARRRLVVNLWTYWLRVNADRKAKKFENEAFTWLSQEDDGSLTSLLSALRLTEGMLESLARKMDDLRKVVDLMELRSIADRELTALEKNCRTMRVIYCRWLRLRSNSFGLSGRQAASTATLNQALDESKRIHNHLEQSLARAAQSKTSTWSERARSSQFFDWEAADDLDANNWHQMLYWMTTTRR
ncbi:adenylate and guanylate cyclase catalytic domain-containing protein [Phthorimaea operculella]|nr:adenylate and guanylate cyclase catalytic domain-containing protein [Phthorimaea operculella]